MNLPKSISSVGIHETKIREALNGQVEYQGDSPFFDRPLVLLAFVNRSGSNLLASHLRTVPQLTGFQEQLNWTTVLKFCEKHNIETFPDYIQFMSKSSGKNQKNHGFKASWDQMSMLMRFGIDRMYTGVKVIHITREDIIGQAISLLMASQTEKWTSVSEGREGIEPVYDEKSLTTIINNCCAAAEQVRLISHLSGAQYLNVTYEDVTARPTNVMRRIGRFVNIKLSQWELQPVALKKQATELNDIWREQYLAAARVELLKLK